MDLASLPSRPLSLEECRELEDSDRFRTLVPAGVFDLAESDRRLVAAVVFVTESMVVAAGYVLAADVSDGTDGTETAGAGAGGWRLVAERAAEAEQAALEEQVREVGAELREWAEGQSWADDPSALLDAL